MSQGEVPRLVRSLSGEKAWSKILRGGGGRVAGEKKIDCQLTKGEEEYQTYSVAEPSAKVIKKSAGKGRAFENIDQRKTRRKQGANGNRRS